MSKKIQVTESLKKIQLSENFYLREFLVSKDHPEIASTMKISDNTITRLTLLCESILQPIRDEWSYQKDAINILSGYRSTELNNAIGGSMNSDHMHSMAADFTSENLLEKFLYLVYMKFPYRQLIYYPDQNFVHVSINMEGKPFKKQTLIKYKDAENYLSYYAGRIPTQYDVIINVP